MKLTDNLFCTVTDPPVELIGKWVLTNTYGTHGAIDVMVFDSNNNIEFFDTKEQAIAYKGAMQYGHLYEVHQISEHYPSLMVYFGRCTESIDDINVRKNLLSIIQPIDVLLKNEEDQRTHT